MPGTAVFLTPYPDHVPHALLHSIKHYKVLHERVVLTIVSVLPVPRAAEAERAQVEQLNQRFTRVTLCFGFMEDVDVPAALVACLGSGLELNPMTTSYFLGRETVVTRPGVAMPYWRQRIFATLHRNARTAADFFKLPPNQVVELGTRVTL